MCETQEISNGAYRLGVTGDEAGVRMRLHDVQMDFVWCDARYVYRAGRAGESGTTCHTKPEVMSVSREGDGVRIRAVLAGLELDHTFELPSDRPIMEERLVLHNPSDSVIALTDFEAGFQRLVTDDVMRVLPECSDDRLVAVPFRRQANDPPGYVNDFSVGDLVTKPGCEARLKEGLGYERVPSRHRYSEGWAWTHGDHTLGVFKYNQEHMEYSVVSTMAAIEGVSLRFGGACMMLGEPAALCRIGPGESVDLGVVRYETVEGGYAESMYAFRRMLDEKGCRFPADYDPPVHWNELYDNPEWMGVTSPGRPAEPRASVRAHTYTKALMEKEAAKARDYSCEALYLDPGWDTKFGTFIWGEQWLGSRKEFVEEMKSKYGLEVSLHCPLATWGSSSHVNMGITPPGIWPRETYRMDAEGKVVEGKMCLGSRQYLEVAERRLLESCADGVAFLMFDGNGWNHGCWNPDHGHPVPYRMEDHIQANVELARRIHAVYPDVLIEMHDMIASGCGYPMTPVYYKFSLPDSYDEKWGFELMWDPLADIKEGRSRATYYYNMGCNIPMYLHIDLRDDNGHCLVFWWFASTCRHLGIGGTHGDPAVASAHKAAMRRYRSLDRFYKRGEFVGINEEIHLHVLPDENAFVANVFNLSDEPRRIEGSVPAGRLGIDADRWYVRDGRVGEFNAETGLFRIDCKMPPWSTELAAFRAV